MSKIFGIMFIFFSLSVKAEISLIQTNNFGDNPGNLKMFTYIPEGLQGKSPLVVLLHGCAQAASDFDDETGWVAEADKKGFIILLPQQTEENNDWRCFNWFNSDDIQRGEGEAFSIIQMIEKVKRTREIDESRIYISGISAGGAMTDAMLALYPEYFKAGAVVAGIPYGCASNGINAWTCMYAMNFPVLPLSLRLEKMRRASNYYKGVWPNVLVVHGTNDQFVNYQNALRMIEQWMNIHNISRKSASATSYNQYVEKSYTSSDGERKVKLISIEGMKHGYPIDTNSNCGTSGKFILDVGICGARLISQFFDL